MLTLSDVNNPVPTPQHTLDQLGFKQKEATNNTNPNKCNRQVKMNKK